MDQIAHYHFIDENGLVVTTAVGTTEIPPNPHPGYTCVPVDPNGNSGNGWTYSNGVFTPPPRSSDPAHNTPPPVFIDPNTAEIATLKTDIATLAQSLTQVIVALNKLTASAPIADPVVE
jgi:hypothetical protein